MNAESRLTDSVKEFFSLIENKDAKRINKHHPSRFYSPRYAFLATTQLLLNYLDLNKLDIIEDQLLEIEKSGEIGVYERDILDHLINLLKKASRPSTKTKKLFIMEDSFGATRIAFVSSTQDISKMSLPEAVSVSDFHKVSEASLTSLYAELAGKGLVKSVQEFNTLYIKAKAQNTIAELHNSLSSLAEKDYRIGLFKNEGQSTYTVRYINATGFGLEKSISSTIKEFIKAMYEEKGDLNLVHQQLMDLVPGLLSRDKDSLAQFLKYFELDSLVDNINVTRRNAVVYEDIIGFIERLGMYKSADQNIDDFLADQAGFLASLSKVLKVNDNLLKASSILDSMGNRIYRYTVKSFFYNMSEYFTKARASVRFKGATGHLKYLTKYTPKFLMTRFYKENIFVNGLNKIYRTFEHDSSKNENSDYSTPFLRESTGDWLFRNFSLGFLSEIGKAPKKLHYTQFLYQVANKPRMPGVQIAILDTNKLREAIASGVRQMLNDNIKFGKKTDINFTVLKEALRNLEKARDTTASVQNFPSTEEITEEIMKILIAKADQFVTEIAENEVKIPGNIGAITAAASKLDINNELGLKEAKLVAKFSLAKDRAYQKADVVRAISPIFRLYYLNNYINGFFVNQLYTGPFNAYKNAEDVVKRMAGVLAPGIKPLVNSIFGTQKTFNVMLLNDTEKDKGDITNFLRELIPDITDERLEEMTKFFETFKSTDGQGFMLPERWNDLSKGYGNSYSLGKVMKPVYFAVHTREVIESKHDSKEEAEAAKAEGQLVKELLVKGETK